MTPICTIEIYYNEDEVVNSRVILDGKSTPICDLPARRVAEILHGLIDPRDGVLSGILKRPFDEKTPLMNMLIGVGIKRLMELVGETQADLQKEQQPAEWSEEDEKMIERLIRHTKEEFDELCKDSYGHQEIISDLKESCRERMNWLENRLKSLRPQPHWKPSEEQMNTLIRAQSQCCPAFAEILQTIHDDLQKLM